MMETPPPRRRAPGMSPERRREMITAVAIPLIVQHGAALTTSQVAQAAGIGEATIFRVFKDKEELIHACILEVVRPDNVIDGITSVPLDQPLEQRLAEASEALSAHLARMGSVLGALHAGGRPSRRDPEQAPDPQARERSWSAMVEAVTPLFAPDAAALRLPVEQAAALFLAQLFSRTQPAPGGEVSTEQAIDLFLHGALRAPASAA
ncbi:TetR/AcrR family transcriptional regulator [Pseudonocardia sp. GCM10023141]|uniref:TetR/AcrR family transcriptional regulator n=1 Tax=Pseudonocardia sp. GCM10023141 TaxID=3252653 RepID=UPI003615BA0D